MDETKYLVFVGDEKAILLNGIQSLPEDLRGYPFIKMTSVYSQVMLMDLIEENEHSRKMIGEQIFKLIKFYGQVGRVCLEFPSWDMMLIYAVKPECLNLELGAEYKDIEQLVESYLYLFGPEFVI
jgi:hypothetical protein